MAPPRRLAPDELIAELVGQDVEFVVIGAVAAIAQGYPLNTQDLDITPSRDPRNIERLATALKRLEARLRVSGEPDGVAFPIEAEFLGKVDSWTLSTPRGDIDLLFVPAGTTGYEDVKRSALRMRLWGHEVLVAHLTDIIRMKEASTRPKDLAQLPALRQTLEIVRERERRQS
ncbi:MAG TPA: hypothetical protein VH968_02725 [Gaiellaceae bacterium]